jgi:hypothetical protein
MPNTLADIDRILSYFVYLCPSSFDFDRQAEWQDRPVANSLAERPLWANRLVFLANAAALLDIGMGAGVVAAAALGLITNLHYVGLEVKSMPLTQSIARHLIGMFPVQARAIFGNIPRALASIKHEPAKLFDRIRINGAEDYITCHTYLLEALRLCTPDGLILVERCDLPHVNEAVVAMLANQTLQIVPLPGWAHAPEQVALQRRPTVSTRSVPGVDQSRIILVAAFGHAVEAEWAISRPSVVAYARRVGAELIEYTDDLSLTLRPVAKMIALDRLQKAGRVLLLDADILIRDHAPDLFDLVPEDAAGMFLEGHVVDRAESLRNSLAWHKFSARKPFYGNTGVFMIPAAYVKNFSLSAVVDMIYTDLMYEQDYFNALLHHLDFPVFNISAAFNFIPAIMPASEMRDHSFFIHFAGGSLGVLQSRVADDLYDPVSSVTIRVRRDLDARDLRVFDLRNEMRLNAGVVDRVLPAAYLVAPRGILLSRRGCFVMCCPASFDVLIWGPYVDLPPGRYTMEVLLSEAAFRRAYLDGIDESAAKIFPGETQSDTTPSSIVLAVVHRGGPPALVHAAEFPVRHGCARVSFTLGDVTEGIECHIRGSGQAFDLYGLRFHAQEAAAVSKFGGAFPA